MAQDDESKAKVGYLTEAELSSKRQAELAKQAAEAAKEELYFRNELNKLGRDQMRNAIEYKNATQAINDLQKDLQQAVETGNIRGARALKNQIAAEQALAKRLESTAGGVLMRQKTIAAEKKKGYEAERELIDDINKELAKQGTITRLFQSQKEKQRAIDTARARSGGGANEPSAGMEAAEEGGIYAAAAAKIKGAIEALKTPFKAVGEAIKNSLSAPLKEAAGLIGGGGFGIGGGKVSGAGATSMLDGVTNLVTGFTDLIPIVGTLVSGLVKGFNMLLQAVLGINQAQVNFARNQGISLKRAQQIRAEFQQISLTSDSIVVNQTRLLESQAELSNALGVTNVMSRSILENDVKLNAIAGLELETRQKIAEVSTITGQDATKLTKTLVGQVGYVKAVTGVSFHWKQVLSEVGKLSGVIGLQFAKYPKQVVETLLKVKTLGFDMKQLRDIASSMLDFESSIAKEFEAQVLTGKELNLTAARQAALTNDYATLSAEITKNVGSTADFLKMSRYEQDSIAESVGMTSDSLADVLRKQEMYVKLGATNQKDAMALFNAQNQTAKGKEKLIELLGEENYAGFTQISIAEKLTAVMDKIKQTFIDFIEKSKIFEFLTDEKRVNGFIRSILNGLSGAVDTVGQIIAGVMEIIGDVVGFFGGDSTKWYDWAAGASEGGKGLAGSIKSIGGGLGPGLADGGVVTQTGMAKVDTGEVYLGANTAQVMKEMNDGIKKQNELLQTIASKNTGVYVDGTRLATATAKYLPTTKYAVSDSNTSYST